jgi:protein-tyrosine phosphatase
MPGLGGYRDPMPFPLDLLGCLNARDLVGLPLRDGARIRPGALLRSDAPHGEFAAIARQLADLGVALVIDLRSPEELLASPHPAATHSAYRNLPFLDPAAPGLPDDVLDSPSALSQIYTLGLDSFGHNIAASVQAVAGAGPGAVLVHCAAGKDRTGTVVAILLRLAGYALSEIHLRAVFAAELVAIDDEVLRRRWSGIQHSRPETIRTMLAHLDNHYGGAEPYLRTHGVSDAELARVRTRLREPESS